MINILVVDDEKDICWVLDTGLRDEGFHITQVANGEEALREVKGRTFDLAIIDVKLPGKNGFEVLKSVRALDPRLKVLMISGYHYENDRPIQEGILQGDFLGFISKPFELDEVATLIKRVIERDL